MKKSVFLTFASASAQEVGKYGGILEAAKRLQDQAKKSNLFHDSRVVSWDEIYSFANSEGISLPREPEKFLFKPILAKMIISKWFGDADYFFYADAGCEINNNVFAKSDFRNMTKNAEKYGFYVEGTRYKDISWCTKELIEQIDSTENHLNSGQVQATFFLVSSAYTHCFRLNELINSWLNIALLHGGKLIGNQYEVNLQSEMFIAPRNDQSILSLLLKKFHFKIFLEKRRGFGTKFFSLRGSNTFLLTSRNRSGESKLPKLISNPLIGTLTVLIKPLLILHDLYTDRFSVRKQYSGFPRESIARQSRWP